jgi:hypothetical protein
MIDHHLIEPESRALGLGPLVLQGLVGGAHPAIENGFHFSCFDLSAEVSSGVRPVPRGKSEPSGQGSWAFFDDL